LQDCEKWQDFNAITPRLTNRLVGLWEHLLSPYKLRWEANE